jgi:hypothetical protein
MNTKETFIERRKHKRYLAGECTYAVLRPPTNIIGQIVDISLSGLAFNYVVSDGKAMKSHYLDLLAAEGLCLEYLPYELIDDFMIPCDEAPFSGLTMHRHCLKFNGITDEQKIKLHDFMKKHGITRTNIA